MIERFHNYLLWCQGNDWNDDALDHIFPCIFGCLLIGALVGIYCAMHYSPGLT